MKFAASLQNVYPAQGTDKGSHFMKTAASGSKTGSHTTAVFKSVLQYAPDAHAVGLSPSVPSRDAQCHVG